jgi:hypothetical protein
MKALWVSGWGIDPGFFKAFVEHVFPALDHTVREPSLQGFSLRGFDWIIGYSLGCSVLLDKYVDASPRTKLALLAPFPAFPMESDRGGKITSAEIRLTKRTLHQDPLLAIHSFYQKAGLLYSLSRLPYDLDSLSGGLDLLNNIHLDLNFLTEAECLIVGNSDPLIDILEAFPYFPESTRVLKNAGHDFRELVPKLPLH